MALEGIKGTGVDLLNTIHDNASEEYRNVVPYSTDENIREVGTALLNYEPAANEFVRTLINRIALVLINRKEARNPLEPLKKGLLTVGSTVEEIYVDLIKAQKYDPRADANEAMKRYLPNVETIFHTVNSQLVYPVSINNDELSNAFTSYGQLDKFIAGIVDSVYSSATNDEFLNMKKLMSLYGKKNLFQPVKVDKVTNKETAEEFVVKVIEVSDRFTILGQDFNAANVWTQTEKNDQYLIVTPHTKARMNVQVLAQAFNMDKAEFMGHIIVIDKFPDMPNVEALLVDRDWLQVYDKMRAFKVNFNGLANSWNYFYHVWMIYSASLFRNAVAFVSEDFTLTKFTLEPASATVDKGGKVQTSVKITTQTGMPSAKCTYTLTGALDNETVVNSVGTVFIGTKEKGTSIKVTATSVDFPSATAFSTITVNQ